MKRYRILESNGNFTIQVEISVTTGFLWWKKQLKKWVKADRFGIGRDYYYAAFDSPPPCRSVEHAKKQIEKWNEAKDSTPIYHYLD